MLSDACLDKTSFRPMRAQQSPRNRKTAAISHGVCAWLHFWCSIYHFILIRVFQVSMFRAFYQSAQFINWPAQSRNYRLGAQFINRVRNLEIESRASNERSVHVLFIA